MGKPWLKDGLKIAQNGVPLLCDECPCDTTCVCTTAEHLTNPDTLPRQTSYEGMYSAYDSDNFVQSGQVYKYEWDLDYYDSTRSLGAVDWVDLGSTGQMGDYQVYGVYSTPAQSVTERPGSGYYNVPACAYLRRRLVTADITRGSGYGYYPYTIPVVQTNITSHDCATTWVNQGVIPEPYLMTPITIEIKLHTWQRQTGDERSLGVVFAANCLTPTGTRQSWDIQTKPLVIDTGATSPIESIKINGVECAQPQWRHDTPTPSGRVEHYYAVPAGTIMPGRLFAPFAARLSDLYPSSVYYSFASLHMTCLEYGNPNAYIHMQASGVVATIPADGDLDYLVPMIDALENNYIEP